MQRGRRSGTERSDAVSAYGSALGSLERRLGGDRWWGLDKWTRSCLVGAQFAFEMLEAVDAARDSPVLWSVGGDGQRAPEIDFSPVVLQLFKAVEVEVHRKLLRPFRDAWRRDGGRLAESEDTEDARELQAYVSGSGPPPSLATTANFLARLCEVRSDARTLAGGLKRWMRSAFVRPDRWWGRASIGLRLARAVRDLRNGPAHTHRLTPDEARRAWNVLWGHRAAEGLVPAALVALRSRPMAGSSIGEFTVVRVPVLKARRWHIEALDGLDEPHDLRLYSGRAEDIRAGAPELKRRMSLAHSNLAPFDRPLPIDAVGRSMIVVPSRFLGRSLLDVLRTGAALAEDECRRLAQDLAAGLAYLHEAGVNHGFVSPDLVTRSETGAWLLSGVELWALAREDFLPYVPPAVRPPEVERGGLPSRTAAGDVYGAAAVVVLARGATSTRNAPRPRPTDVSSLFADVGLAQALAAALEPQAERRPVDGTAFLRSLGCGAVRGPGAARSGRRIFLSYSRKDATLAERIVEELSREGLDVFRDVTDIIGGAIWKETIVDAIDSADVVLFLATPQSIRSPHVAKELNVAESSGKPIVPLFVGDIDLPGELRYVIAGVQHLVLDEEDWAGSAASLRTALANVRTRGI